MLDKETFIKRETEVEERKNITNNLKRSAKHNEKKKDTIRVKLN